MNRALSKRSAPHTQKILPHDLHALEKALARLLRAGELTAVNVPEPTDEAIRDEAEP